MVSYHILTLSLLLWTGAKVPAGINTKVVWIELEGGAATVKRGNPHAPWDLHGRHLSLLWTTIVGATFLAYLETSDPSRPFFFIILFDEDFCEAIRSSHVIPAAIALLEC